MPARRKPTTTNARLIAREEPVTLSMVANAAGVSASTVSRILNGTAAVNEAKSKAVQEAIAALGYIPNPVARGLAGGRTLSIGVVTQSIDSPFYGVALRGIEDELDRAGYSPLFVSGHWNATEEARCIDMLRSRRVDGIIVLTGRLSDSALKQTAKHLPVVATGRKLRAPNLFSLDFDNQLGARLATQHLIELGHRRIAFIAGNAEHPDANERLNGYKSGLEQAGISFDSELVAPGLFHEESGLLATERLLDTRRRFTALFAANDQMALGACLALHRRGLRIPTDVAVMGFDDLSISRYSTPPLSTIHHPAYELGQGAASAMLCLLRGEKPSFVLPGPQVVARESTNAKR
ncbi:MAG: LacI family DNA-binding transcriptional regulator [Burkholderiaceae bacterium]|jgi:LacI family transcriptional regulator